MLGAGQVLCIFSQLSPFYRRGGWVVEHFVQGHKASECWAGIPPRCAALQSPAPHLWPTAALCWACGSTAPLRWAPRFLSWPPACACGVILSDEGVKKGWGVVGGVRVSKPPQSPSNCTGKNNMCYFVIKNTTGITGNSWIRLPYSKGASCLQLSNNSGKSVCECVCAHAHACS